MRYAIGLGGNLGDVPATAARAAKLLVAEGVTVVAEAPWLITEPVGGPTQPRFHNSAWIVETGLGPHGLLAALQRTETACGRTREVPWGPRTLDLDLLLCEDGRQVCSAMLELPHPRLHVRPFALRPLAAIAGGWVHPIFRETITVLGTK